jgi:hypothetical protein
MFVLLHPLETLQEKNLPTLYDHPEKGPGKRFWSHTHENTKIYGSIDAKHLTISMPYD